MSRIIYLPLPILILLLSLISAAQAERVQIFDIRKNLPMSAKETVFKDYYLSGGRNVGLKENMIVSVYRILPLHDHHRNEARGQLKLKVGQLKLLSVGENNAVARIYKMADHKGSPVLEFDGFLMGDVIELTDAYMEKSASAEAPASTEVPAEVAEKPAAKPVQNVELKAGNNETERTPAEQKTPPPQPASPPALL